MKTYGSFTEAYVSLLKAVYNTPEFEAAPRGMAVRERLGHSFRITNIRDRIPYVPHRKFSIAYMIAELLWYLSGNNKTEWISNYSGFWRNISDDGETANSAYGARIFRAHPYQLNGSQVSQDLDPMCGFTQWDYLKEELRRDPDSRRAVLHIRMPQDSVLAQKDVPCTLTLQFFIRDSTLHQVASMRSSDLILGIAYDIPAFTMFQELLAFELGVECGTYTHISNSLHIYEKHYGMVERILKDPWVREFPTRAQPMKPMTTMPPINLMMEWEGRFRAAQDERELGNAVSDFCDFTIKDDESSIDRYWQGWMFVLASHRARQLGLDDFRQKLISTSAFPGFTLFEK